VVRHLLPRIERTAATSPLAYPDVESRSVEILCAGVLRFWLAGLDSWCVVLVRGYGIHPSHKVVRTSHSRGSNTSRRRTNLEQAHAHTNEHAHEREIFRIRPTALPRQTPVSRGCLMPRGGREDKVLLDRKPRVMPYPGFRWRSELRRAPTLPFYHTCGGHMDHVRRLPCPAVTTRPAVTSGEQRSLQCAIEVIE